MELAARDQRDEVRCGVPAVFRPHEEPAVASPRDPPQLALGPVVVDRHAPVVEERPQRVALVLHVVDRLREGRLVDDLQRFVATPSFNVSVEREAARSARSPKSRGARLRCAALCHLWRRCHGETPTHAVGLLEVFEQTRMFEGAAAPGTQPAKRRFNHMKTFQILALAAFAANLVACSSEPGGGSTSEPVFEKATSALPRDTAPTVSSEERESLAESSEALTSKLVGALRASEEKALEGNFAFSPVSIATALSMPYAGARGTTATQMAAALGWNVPQARVAKLFNWATLGYGERAGKALEEARRDVAGDTSQSPDAANFRLHLVNSVWARRDVAFEKPFLDTLAVDYGSGVTLADFRGNPDGEREKINGWVAAETSDKIKDLIPKRAITQATAAVLVNAVHLKMPWGRPMSVEPTESPFARAGGGETKATFLATTGRYGYAEDANAQAVELPLKGGDLAFVLVVPKSGLEAFEGGLATNLPAIRKGLATREATVSLPKFKFTTESISLKKPLESLGIVDAFDELKADFSGVTKSERLYVSDVVHKAMVGVDEKGVEAAAATAVVFGESSALPAQPVKVRADRPFFFAIVDKPTNTILFAGHVKDPSR
jgi:serpin B